MATLSGFLMSAKWNLERQFTIEAAKGRERYVGNQKLSSTNPSNLKGTRAIWHLAAKNG